MERLAFSELSEHATNEIKNSVPSPDAIKESMKPYSGLTAPVPNKQLDTEVLNGITFSHHFTDVSDNYENLCFHWVSTGNTTSEPIVFLHGLPDSWFMWYNQMAALSPRYHCIAFDLKGYGQSSKTIGDYRHERAAEQMYQAIQKIIGSAKFNIISHDRGTIQADYIVANHATSILRFGRGEQHLYHCNPILMPQGDLLAEAPRTGLLDNPTYFVTWAYDWLTRNKPSKEVMSRVIQEFMYEDIKKAVPRYYNTQTMQMEWVERRSRLIAAWTGMPIMFMQGSDSRTQPREYYENVLELLPGELDARVKWVPGGHFWPLEYPEETTAALEELLML